MCYNTDSFIKTLKDHGYEIVGSGKECNWRRDNELLGNWFP